MGCRGILFGLGVFCLFVCFLEPYGIETILHLSKSQDSSVLPHPETLEITFHV